MKLKIIIIVFLSLFLFSCNDDENNCTNLTIPTISLEAEYGCVNTKYQTDIDLSDDFTIIGNQAQYDALVSGSCQPTIDFAQYDLIIGKKALTSGNTEIEYDLVENCKTKNQQLTVTFQQNLTSEAPNLTYHVLVPKLSENQEVTVQILVSNILPEMQN